MTISNNQVWETLRVYTNLDEGVTVWPLSTESFTFIAGKWERGKQ